MVSQSLYAPSKRNPRLGQPFIDRHTQPGRRAGYTVQLVSHSDTRYNRCDDKNVQTQGLQRFFETGSKAGIQAAHAAKLRLQLAALDQAIRPEDLSAPSWELHPLKGDLRGHWAVTVNGNWRMIFAFDGTDAVLVDYLDYH
ncbi:MAG TPA: type II toxin-antitoxin system RelE/ParE family toxin [Telluria sp.]